MATWLDNAAKKAGVIAPETIYRSEQEVDTDCEHVVGVASEKAQQLFTLAMRLKRASKEREIVARFDPSPELRAQALKDVYEYQKKAENLVDAFWITIQDDFGLWGKTVTGIREGWQIVWIEVEGVPPEITRSLLNRIAGSIMVEVPMEEPRKKEKKSILGALGQLFRSLRKR